MADMSRQHYTRLADTLGRAVAIEAQSTGGEGVLAAGAAYRVALAVAEALRSTSPRYDGLRFINAVDAEIVRAIEILGNAPIDSTRGAGYCAANAMRMRAASRF